MHGRQTGWSPAVTGEVTELLREVRIEPRGYQLRIIEKAVRLFEGTYVGRGQPQPEAGSVMIESPTGSGKTVMGLAIARYFQQAYGWRVGWVAMRRNLLHQTERENVERGFGLQLELISMFDKQPPAVDLLIVDEAQHDAAMSMANLHCLLRPKKVLGLTATPFRTDRVKLCFDQVIRDAGIHQLIQDGYLSRYHHYTIPRYTPEMVAEFLVNDPERWGKSLVFFHQRAECYECQSLLARQGIAAEVVTASTDRQRQLELFEADDVRVLINMAILTEGFDCPSLKTVFCRPSGKSCTVQMAGRVLRQHPELPYKQVVQCTRTPHPFIKTAMADGQFVWGGDCWRSLTLNQQIEEVSQRARRLVSRTPVQLPRLVAANRQRSRIWQRAAG